MKLDERRGESRIRSRGRVDLVAEGKPRVAGRIYDVSVLGISVDSDHEICPGTRIQIDGEGFEAEGVVRYCGGNGTLYRIGVELIPAAPG